MRQYAVKLQNVLYSDRVPLINLLKSKGERIYKLSAIDHKEFMYTGNSCFAYIIAGNCWLSDNADNYDNLITIPEFLRLYSISFKEL